MSNQIKVNDKIICIDNGHAEQHLDLGKKYTVLEVTDEYFRVSNDNISHAFFIKARFIKSKNEEGWGKW
jgi:hypothetical protein